MKMQQRHVLFLGASCLMAVLVFVLLYTVPARRQPKQPAAARGAIRSKGQASNGANINPGLAAALDAASPLATEERAALLRNRTGARSQDETELLLSSLAAPCPPSMSLSSFALLFNETANLLERQGDEAVLAPFGKVLVGLAKDGARPEILRDYAIQHLRVVWTRAARIPALRASVEDAFWSMSSGSGHPAAASLLSLHLLGTPDHPPGPATPYGVSTEKLQGRTLELLSDPSAPPGTRMAAARIAAERGIRQARDPLLAAASDHRQPLAARLAAVAAFGHLGAASDLPALRSLGASSPELTTAVASASARIAPP